MGKTRTTNDEYESYWLRLSFFVKSCVISWKVVIQSVKNIYALRIEDNWNKISWKGKVYSSSFVRSKRGCLLTKNLRSVRSNFLRFPFHVFFEQNLSLSLSFSRFLWFLPFLVSFFLFDWCVSLQIDSSCTLSFSSSLFASDARIWIHTGHSSIIMHCYCSERHEGVCAFNASGDRRPRI